MLQTGACPPKPRPVFFFFGKSTKLAISTHFKRCRGRFRAFHVKVAVVLVPLGICSVWVGWCLVYLGWVVLSPLGLGL